MSGCPSDRQVVGGHVAIALVSVVLVLYYAPAGDRGGLHYPVVVEHNLVPGFCKVRSHGARHAFYPINLLGLCTRKAARNSPLLMPPPALPWRFEPSVYHCRVVVQFRAPLINVTFFLRQNFLIWGGVGGWIGHNPGGSAPAPPFPGTPLPCPYRLPPPPPTC